MFQFIKNLYSYSFVRCAVVGPLSHVTATFCPTAWNTSPNVPKLNYKVLTCLRAHLHLAQLLCTVWKCDCPSSPVPCWPALTLLRPQPGLSMITSGMYVITSWCSCSTMENNTENRTLLTFMWLILYHFGHRRPLTFLDFLIVQGRVIPIIILHVHVVHLCLCSYNCIVLKHTPFSDARAKNVCVCVCVCVCLSHASVV